MKCLERIQATTGEAPHIGATGSYLGICNHTFLLPHDLSRPASSQDFLPHPSLLASTQVVNRIRCRLTSAVVPPSLSPRLPKFEIYDLQPTSQFRRKASQLQLDHNYRNAKAIILRVVSFTVVETISRWYGYTQGIGDRGGRYGECRRIPKQK